MGSGDDIGEVEQRFDWTETPPSSAIVETVAVAADTEPTDLDAIQYTIDADALDTLLGDATGRDEFRISFEYAGNIVTVTGTGLVRVALD
jgi:hypothetical protein